MKQTRAYITKKCSLYPLDYKNRDTRVFLYLYGDSLAVPAQLSKSFSQFVMAAQLETMQQLAEHKKQILIPSLCFDKAKKAKLKRGNTFGFRCSKYYYFMLPASELSELEIQNYYKFCRSLKHNRTYFSELRRSELDRNQILHFWKQDYLKMEGA